MPFEMRLAAASLFVLLAGPALAVDAFVTNEKGNSVTVLDLDRLTVRKTIPVGQRPRGVVASPDGKIVYVALGDDDMVAAMCVAKEGFRAVAGPLDGTTDLAGGPYADGLLGVDEYLRAEAAADVRRDDAQLVLGRKADEGR